MKIYDIGIDVGGTFTDLVSFDVESSTLAWKKVPTTPENPVNGVLAALEGKAPKVKPHYSRDDIRDERDIAEKWCPRRYHYYQRTQRPDCNR